ncbi:hypothetical protein SAMD00023353_4800250 [Rosellinia necatrix]|uniref:Uncharacterized protein n=1 Tax=Rosellinia necatrix TaxID=77044 RepID=A0A1W2TQE4_ROSNE|nr:hypothetical protein SAMD00023353_4800250 [Rosellinia necatrix]
MPNFKVAIAAPLREAPIECYRAATRLVRPGWRRRLVLVGGTARVAHSPAYKTDDVDVTAPPGVLIDLWKDISAVAHNFSFESHGKIVPDALKDRRAKYL